jgi:hypothetical protein
MNNSFFSPAADNAATLMKLCGVSLYSLSKILFNTIEGWNKGQIKLSTEDSMNFNFCFLDFNILEFLLHLRY